jgi:hypothetical protein
MVRDICAVRYPEFNHSMPRSLTIHPQCGAVPALPVRSRLLVAVLLALAFAAGALVRGAGAPETRTVTLARGERFPPVTASWFDPASIGAPAPRAHVLRNLLVTGDSMSQPLNTDLYLALHEHGVHVYSDLHYGGGISKDFVFDWPREATVATRQYRPDATVVFIGANEGFPLRGANGRMIGCCGPHWAAAYANRARSMTATYLRYGGRVYWIAVPALRDVRRTAIGRVINEAVRVAFEPWRRQVRQLDAGAIFTPDGYRDSMPVNGVDTVVRKPDGMHLTDAGSQVLADAVTAQLLADFTLPGG